MYFLCFYTWLLKVIKGLRLLRRVIDLRPRSQSMRGKKKSMAPCARYSFPQFKQVTVNCQLGILISSSFSLLLLWLVGVTTLVIIGFIIQSFKTGLSFRLSSSIVVLTTSCLKKTIYCLLVRLQNISTTKSCSSLLQLLWFFQIYGCRICQRKP